MDKQKILNDAVHELGNRLINTASEYAQSDHETVKALVEASTTEKGTPDPEKCVITIMSMTFVEILTTVPGSDNMRAILLGQLAGMSFQKSKALGGKPDAPKS